MGKFNESIKLYDEYLERYPNFPKDEIKYEKEQILSLMKN